MLACSFGQLHASIQSCSSHGMCCLIFSHIRWDKSKHHSVHRTYIDWPFKKHFFLRIHSTPHLWDNVHNKVAVRVGVATTKSESHTRMHVTSYGIRLGHQQTLTRILRVVALVLRKKRKSYLLGKAFKRRFSSLSVMAMTVPWRGVKAPSVLVSWTCLKVFKSVLLQNW